MFYRTGVMADQNFTLREQGFFNLVCSCDLDLDPMTFIYELNPHCLEIYRMCKYELIRQGFLKLSSDRQTDRQTDGRTDTTEIIYHAASRASSNNDNNNNKKMYNAHIVNH